MEGGRRHPPAFERKIPGFMLGDRTENSEEPGKGFESATIGSARARIDWCLRGNLDWNLQVYGEKIWGVS